MSATVRLAVASGCCALLLATGCQWPPERTSQRYKVKLKDQGHLEGSRGNRNRANREARGVARRA